MKNKLLAAVFAATLGVSSLVGVAPASATGGTASPASITISGCSTGVSIAPSAVLYGNKDSTVTVNNNCTYRIEIGGVRVEPGAHTLTLGALTPQLGATPEGFPKLADLFYDKDGAFDWGDTGAKILILTPILESPDTSVAGQFDTGGFNNTTNYTDTPNVRSVYACASATVAASGTEIPTGCVRLRDPIASSPSSLFDGRMIQIGALEMEDGTWKTYDAAAFPHIISLIEIRAVRNADLPAPFLSNTFIWSASSQVTPATPIAPVLTTSATLSQGTENPGVRVFGSGLSPSLSASDFNLDLGSTTLTLDNVLFSTGEVVFSFTGTAAVGDITIQAKRSAFTSDPGVDSETLVITVASSGSSQNSGDAGSHGDFGQKTRFTSSATSRPSLVHDSSTPLGTGAKLTVTPASWSDTDFTPTVVTHFWLIASGCTLGGGITPQTIFSSSQGFDGDSFTVPAQVNVSGAGGSQVLQTANMVIFVVTVASNSTTYSDSFSGGFQVGAGSCQGGTTTSTTTTADAVRAAPFTGPVLNTPAIGAAVAGGKLVISGSNLGGVSKVEVGGLDAQVVVLADGSIELTVPSGLAAGVYDIVITSAAGRVTVQGGLTVRAGSAAGVAGEPRPSTKMIAANTVKVWVFEAYGAGKVQIMLNGREVAWVNAASADDPKLRDGYLVRTLALAAGKNVIEVYVDGERVSRRVATGS